MIRASRIGTALVASFLTASVSSASWVVTFSRASGIAGRDRVDLYARNNGQPTVANPGGTGTGMKALEVNGEMLGGAKAYFHVLDLTDPNLEDPDGIPDTLDMANLLLAGNTSSIRINSNSAANNLYLYEYFSPTLPGSDGARNPVLQPHPWVNGLTSFKAVSLNLGTTSATTGQGFRFASLFVDAGAELNAHGIFGNEMSSVNDPWSIQVRAAPTPEPAILSAFACAVPLVRRRR